MLVSASSYRSLPTYSGAYLFLNRKSKVIYVGKAKNLKKRVSSYFMTKDLGQKTQILVSQISKIKTLGVSSEIESFLLEERLIKKYTPKYNMKLTDDKRYPSLKITVKDEYPKVLIVRKQENDGSIYFGPYTSSSSLRLVLKLLRRVFPYQAVLNHPRKLCLYYHLGLCPCPTVTKNANYSKTIKHIIEFLNGDIKKLTKDLKKERKSLSKKENYEQAQEIQRKIEAIALITSRIYKPFEYELNPNLRSDVIFQELNDLKHILNKHEIKVSNFSRIECYDISNTSGKNATGSMVVFINGEKDPSSYKRFRIKRDYKNMPNDFAMLQEVLQRRLKHSDWPTPTLIIVDGGKGQVSTIRKILLENNLKIPLIGLAKREEIIITHLLKEIKLPKDSKSLQLIMRIRDEAHRFAITYHKKLRARLIFS